MEGIREIASAYYARASEQERNSAKEFFDTLDADGNGKVSFLEFKASVGSWLCERNLFRQLDENRDGTLDFNESLALHYIEKLSIRKCDVCRDFLLGPYFSCLLCLENGSDTYDLCCDCFHGGEFQHEHPSSKILDHHSLLNLFREHMAEAQKNQGKKQRKMDGIREIASAYYARASEEERNSAKEYFKTLDADGDGKVSLPEFKASVGSWLCDENLFKQLDENGDGALDFNEALALYYMVKKVRITRCNGCRDLLVGPYFSCLLCLGKVPNTCDLCCACYHGGKFQHQHPPSKFLDHHALLMLFRDRTTDAEKNQGKKEIREMDGIREIASAFYARASEEERNSAKEYFKTLDADGDGKVSLMEFKASVKSWLRDDNLFKQLDKNGDGALDFDETLALYYMSAKVRITRCNGCRDLLVGPYFSCLLCLGKVPNTCDLCCACYHGGKFQHHHPPSKFLDHHSLLMLFRDRTTDAEKNKVPPEAPLFGFGSPTVPPADVPRNQRAYYLQQLARLDSFSKAIDEWKAYYHKILLHIEVGEAGAAGPSSFVGQTSEDPLDFGSQNW